VRDKLRRNTAHRCRTGRLGKCADEADPLPTKTPVHPILHSPDAARRPKPIGQSPLCHEHPPNGWVSLRKRKPHATNGIPILGDLLGIYPMIPQLLGQSGVVSKSGKLFVAFLSERLLFAARGLSRLQFRLAPPSSARIWLARPGAPLC